MNYRFKREYDEIMNIVQQHNGIINGLDSKTVKE